MKAEEIGNRIKMLLENNDIDYKTFANEIGMSKRKLLKKLNGKLGFTLEEATKIKNCLHLELELANKIFFEPNTKINI